MTDHEKGTQLFSVPLRNSLPPAGIEPAKVSTGNTVVAEVRDAFSDANQKKSVPGSALALAAALQGLPPSVRDAVLALVMATTK